LARSKPFPDPLLTSVIATGHFVFLHLHKSGGTFVNEWLLRFFPDARQIGYHLPRRLIPAEFSSLPVLGLVRNPWSYYVSWYAFQSGLARPNALFKVLSEGRTLGFEGTVRNMLDLGAGGGHLDTLVSALPDTYTGRGLNLPGPEFAAIRETGLGFYSYLYRYMYAGEGPAHVRRMEGLRYALPSLLSTVGAGISPAAESFLRAAPASNSSAHRRYTEYYEDSLRDLVAERDGDLIREFDYRFDE
jgi:hypothetical protein